MLYRPSAFLTALYHTAAMLIAELAKRGTVTQNEAEKYLYLLLRAMRMR